MVSHVSNPSPIYALLAVARAGGGAFWSMLATLPRRLFHRHWGSLRVKFTVVIVALQPTFKGYWHMVMIFRFDTVLKATQTSSLGQKRLS